MSSILSDRVQKVKPSATMAVSDKAKELKSQGIQIVSMAQESLTLIRRLIFRRQPLRQLEPVRPDTRLQIEHLN